MTIAAVRTILKITPISYVDYKTIYNQKQLFFTSRQTLTQRYYYIKHLHTQLDDKLRTLYTK